MFSQLENIDGLKMWLYATCAMMFLFDPNNSEINSVTCSRVLYGEDELPMTADWGQQVPRGSEVVVVRWSWSSSVFSGDTVSWHCDAIWLLWYCYLKLCETNSLPVPVSLLLCLHYLHLYSSPPNSPQTYLPVHHPRQVMVGWRLLTHLNLCSFAPIRMW